MESRSAASVKDFERIRTALDRGEDYSRLLEGREFNHRHWINAKAALGRIERRLGVAEHERSVLLAVYADA